jgi:hypothetical protein
MRGDGLRLECFKMITRRNLRVKTADEIIDCADFYYFAALIQ